MRWHERAVEAMHAAALAIWLAVLAGAGLAAAVSFPEMKRLEPRVPSYGAYEGEHWMIVAGHIGRRVFDIADRTQLIAAAVAVVTLAAVTRLRIAGGTMLALRWAGVGVAASLAVYNGLALAPRMDERLVAYWAAAKAGENEKAKVEQAAFSADHPSASRVLQVGALAVFVAIIAAAGSRNPAATRST